MKNLKKGFIILFLAVIAFSNLPATEVSAATNKVTATKSTKKKKIPSVKKGTNIVSVKKSSSWKDSKAVKFTVPKTGYYIFDIGDLKSSEDGMAADFAFFNNPKRKKVMKILDFSSGKKEKLDFGTVYDGCGSRIVVSLHKGQTLYLGSNKTKAITKEKVKVEGEEYQRVLSNGKTVTRRRPSYTKTVETEKEKSFDYSYKLKIKFSKNIPKY